ncbi:MAG: PilZ domain-containing protein [Minicystis sp.]
MLSDKRQHPRKIIEAEVAFQIGQGPRVDARCRDVSIGGMFIETGAPPPYGTPVRVFMRLPGLRSEATIDAIVRWSKPDGMGVQFGVMGARETHGLTQLLTGH